MNCNFEFNHRTRILFGAGIASDAGAEIKQFGSRALVISDRGLKGLGIVETVGESLTENGIYFEVYDKIRPNPRDTECREAADQGLAMKADVIVGIGGGSSMDAAKATGVLMSNGGDCASWAKIRKFDKPLLPVICIPTTSGTGSEVTFEAVITASELGKKVSMSDGAKMAPCLAVMDPKLTETLPPLITASTGMDALTHAIEAYTCLYAQPVTDGLALYAMEKIGRSIVEASENGKNLKAREDMMLGSLLAGMAFTNSFLGAVHAFSETLGGYYDIPHGIANAIFLPYVTEYNMESDLEKHGKVAAAIGVDTYGMSPMEASQAGVKRLFELNEILKIPLLSELDVVNPGDFQELSELCSNHVCGAKANPVKIEKSDYMIIFDKAYNAERD